MYMYLNVHACVLSYFSCAQFFEILWTVVHQTPLSYLDCLICTWGFPGDSASKESVCNVGDLSLIPGLGRPPEEGKGYPLQYSGLKNIVHGVTKSWTRLSDFQDHLCQRTYHLVQDSPRRNKGEPGPAPAGQACCRPEQPPSLTHA